MCHPDINASPMGNLKRTGGLGREKNTWDKHKSLHEGKERHDMEKGEHKPGRGRGKGK